MGLDKVTRRRALQTTAGITLLAIPGTAFSPEKNIHSKEDRDDIKIVNNDSKSHELLIGLQTNQGRDIPILDEELRGFNEQSVSPRSMKYRTVSQISVDKRGIYPLIINLDGEQVGQRNIPIPNGGFPDYQSVFVDIREQRTSIYISEV